MSADGPAFMKTEVPTVDWMQYVVAVADLTMMCLMPASYEACSTADVAPEYVPWSALNASMPGTAARTLACAAELLARSLNLRYDGIAIASRIPMMMMTTRSSMRVKPSLLCSRVRSLFSICSMPLPKGFEWVNRWPAP